MILGLVCIIFLGGILLSVPLVWAILLAAVAPILLLHLRYPLDAIYLSYATGLESFTYIAIPLFIIAGELMSRGGMGLRIVRFARALLGFLPGGLGIVSVVASMIFGGISGSALADTAAVGSIMIPNLIRQRYTRGFSAALIAAAGTIGIIVPPSIPLLIYGFVASVSVSDLFLAGIVPGLVFALALILYCIWIGRRSGCDMGGERTSVRELGRAFVGCLPALLMPALIIGSIFSGTFTPTEAAGLAVVYGLLIACVLYRELPWRDVPKLLVDCFVTSSVILLVVGATAALAWLIAAEQMPVLLGNLVRHYAGSGWTFLLLVNIVLLILGHVLEPIPAIILTVPMFMPIAKSFHIDPVHLGVIMTCNLALGLFTPPIGVTLFVATKIAGIPVFSITRELMPLFLIGVAVLLLITYVPVLPLGLVWLIRS